MNRNQTTNSEEPFCGFYRQKRIWLSGHTGFKGSWLAQWLLELGAEVSGYALKPDTRPALFHQLGLARQVRHETNDIRDAAKVRRSILSFRPDMILHLAAQPLVRRSYALPRETYETNVMGTLHVLEAVREYGSSGNAPRILPVVVITTDKVYENLENGRRYRETDRLGGHDPYSSSKAMVELLVASHRSSFFRAGRVRLASARAGNVIGGGDWAEDRIVPDAIRALQKRKPVPVRNPASVRPWQHVLEPLSGYLALGAALAGVGIQDSGFRTTRISNPTCQGSFNFGPNRDANRTVMDLVKEVLKHWPGVWRVLPQTNAPHEAGLLQLDNTLARRELGWRPKWGFRQAVAETVVWYHDVHRRRLSPQEATRRQIERYAK